MKRKVLKTACAVILVLVVAFVLIICTADKPVDNVKISKDYVTITVDSKQYDLREFNYDMPEDCVEYTPTVEGKDFWYYVNPFSEDVVYVSETQTDYVWLVTKTESTNNTAFERAKSYHEVLTYRVSIK